MNMRSSQVLYPFRLILCETLLTSVGRRSYRRQVAVLISCGLGIYKMVWKGYENILRLVSGVRFEIFHGPISLWNGEN